MNVTEELELDFVLEPHAWCSAPIKDQPVGWRAGRGYGNSCQRHAVYLVNGQRLCRMHAGNNVLDTLLASHPTHFYNKSNQPSIQVKPGVKVNAK